MKLPKIDTEKLNSHLTIAIKSLSVIAIATGIYIGASTYSTLSHSGPSCKSNIENFEYWLDNGKIKGDIVSIHESKLQLEDGSTKCFGTYRTKGGLYKDWKGEITEIDNWDFIGNAKVIK